MKYFSRAVKKSEKIALMKEIDTDGDATIDAEEFYRWMVLNTENEGILNEDGTKGIKRRERRLNIIDEVPKDLVNLLDEVRNSFKKYRIWIIFCALIGDT